MSRRNTNPETTRVRTSFSLGHLAATLRWRHPQMYRSVLPGGGGGGRFIQCLHGLEADGARFAACIRHCITRPATWLPYPSGTPAGAVRRVLGTSLSWDSPTIPGSATLDSPRYITNLGQSSAALSPCKPPWTVLSTLRTWDSPQYVTHLGQSSVHYEPGTVLSTSPTWDSPRRPGRWRL